MNKKLTEYEIEGVTTLGGNQLYVATNGIDSGKQHDAIYLLSDKD
jgi:hypothetical protein